MNNEFRAPIVKNEAEWIIICPLCKAQAFTIHELFGEYCENCGYEHMKPEGGVA